MNNYILLQSKNLKLYLQSKDGVWKCQIAGKKYEFNDSMERLFAYLIFGTYNTSELASTLRLYNKNILPPEIDKFIEDFKASHTVENVEFDLESIPAYATNEKYLYIPNPYSYSVALNVEQEQELLAILKDTTINRKARLEWWFGSYIRRYGLTPKYKRDYEGQEQELAMQFCRQYGLNVNTLCHVENIPQQVKEKITIKYILSDIKRTLQLICILMGYTSIALGLILWGDHLVEKGWFWCGAIISIIGWAMFCIPLYLIFGRRK